MNKRQCKTCRFWNDEEYEVIENHALQDVGECRRSPPTVIVDDVRQSRDPDGELKYETNYKSLYLVRRRTVWPVTRSRDWCGRYRADAEAVAADIKDYRIDREATDLMLVAKRVAEYEAQQSVEGGAPVDGKDPLVAHSRKLTEEMRRIECADWEPEIRGRAIAMAAGLAHEEAIQWLLRWVTMDEALADLVKAA